jgi:hypothetical protein
LLSFIIFWRFMPTSIHFWVSSVTSSLQFSWPHYLPTSSRKYLSIYWLSLNVRAPDSSGSKAFDFSYSWNLSHSSGFQHDFNGTTNS